MLTFSFNVPEIGDLFIKSDSYEQAENILLAYLDKHSLNYNYT